MSIYHRVARTIMVAFAWACCVLLLAAVAQAGHYDVYILTGQSNSLGTTSLESGYAPGAHPADAETAFFWSNVSGVGSSDPNTIVLYGNSGGNITTLQVQQGNDVNPAFWGPEMGFARTLYDAGRRNVMILKITRGGGGNEYWLPNTGHMYNHIMEQLDLAFGRMAAGDSFDVKGLLYVQGESNGTAAAAAADTRLQLLIDGVQDHINTKYSGGAEQMRTFIGEIAASQSNANRQLTTEKQKALAESDPDIFFVPTRDLPLKSDGIHFGRDAKLEIGARFARAVLGQPIVPDDPTTAVYSADEGGEEIPSPFAQGWTEVGAGPGVALEGVVIDDTRAWRVADDSTTSNPGYRQALSLTEIQELHEKGWIMSLKVQVVRGGGLAFWSLDAGADPGWGVGSGSMTGFLLERLADDSLDVTLWPTNWKMNLGPGSADDFHTLEIEGAPFSTAFKVFIDGAFVTSGTMKTNYMVSGYNNMASFLSGSTGDVGREIAWNRFELRAVPEPSCMLLLIMGGILFARRYNRREAVIAG